LDVGSGSKARYGYLPPFGKAALMEFDSLNLLQGFGAEIGFATVRA